LNCPNCGEEVRDEDALFCPYCANRLTLARKRSGFQIAAGVLTIIGACISISIGLLWLVAFAMYFRTYPFYTPTSYFLATGIFNVFAFAFGLMSGIFTLRRKHFALSMIGVSLVLVSGFVIIRSLEVMGYEALMGYLVFGVPIVILSLLGLIFAAISRNEFV
jgi:hypothetical protein